LISKLGVICNNCFSIALNGACECGKVASKEDTLYNALRVYSNSPKDCVLTKVWLNDAGVIYFITKYKDLTIARFLPVNIINEE
jgi:hypothetical protein